ncbi:polysaccharide biosynthesis/export family protein [Paludibacter sp.]
MFLKKSFKYFIILAVVILSGCKAYEQVAYLQQSGSQAILSDSVQSPIPDPLIKNGDLLMITINSNTPEAAMPFNLPLIPSGETARSYSGGNGSYLSYGMGMQNFLVDMNGDMTFPVIGKIHVAGLTKLELEKKIKSAIFPKYITEEPIILIRYMNFKVSVLGEVARPGSFYIDNEKISILEALATAGDMTIFGKRNSVLLIREDGEKRETVRLDLRDKNLVNSPYYYLQQNDVIYVEPNDAKARSSAISSAESLSISIVGTLISIATLVINILR